MGGVFPLHDSIHRPAGGSGEAGSPGPESEGERQPSLAQELDDLIQLAASICTAPIALISLVDSGRPQISSKLDLTPSQTERLGSFCSESVLSDAPLIVLDARADERFADHPTVTGAPHVRFYCGVPLTEPGGQRIGTLAVIDVVPREFAPEQLDALRLLVSRAVDHLTLVRRHRELLATVGPRPAEAPPLSPAGGGTDLNALQEAAARQALGSSVRENATGRCLGECDR